MWVCELVCVCVCVCERLWNRCCCLSPPHMSCGSDLHVYFNSSSIAEVSPHLVFSGRRAKVAHGVPRVFFPSCKHTHMRARVVFHTGGVIECIHTCIHTYGICSRRSACWPHILNKSIICSKLTWWSLLFICRIFRYLSPFVHKVLKTTFERILTLESSTAFMGAF